MMESKQETVMESLSVPTLTSTKVEDTSSGSVKEDQNGIPKDPSKKRDDYLNWSDYFMGVAFLSAMRSKDPCTQVMDLFNNLLQYYVITT